MIRTILIASLCLTLGVSDAWSVEDSKSANERYDPLKTPSDPMAEPQDFTLKDDARDREIPIRVYLPAASESAPVVLFSHGLGGSRNGSSYLGKHWSARGYVVVFLQHHGTDESIWKDVPLRERMASFKAAMSIAGTVDRFNDVKFVIDELDRLNKETGHPVSGRLEMQRVGMSGHSYGALTTQGVSGQSAPLIRQKYNDSRIDAAVMFSPSTIKRGNASRAFGSVSIPWMMMTGTKDTSVVSDTTVEQRRAVYSSLPESIDKYELVLDEAEHLAFSDGAVRGRGKRNPNHHRVILALSTAFWDTYLGEDDAAKKWLQNEQAKAVMEPKDLWQLNLSKTDDTQE